MHQRVRAKLRMHLSLAPRELGGGGAWRWPCTCVWWSGRPCSSPHLPEKYNGTVNPIKFLQIYSTSILAIGGNEAVMANYFPVALTGTARSWLMNLSEGTLHS
jgi:hypothetical protein